MEWPSIWNPNCLELDPESTTSLTSLWLNSARINTDSDRLLFRSLHYVMCYYVTITYDTAWHMVSTIWYGYGYGMVSMVSTIVCLLFLYMSTAGERDLN